MTRFGPDRSSSEGYILVAVLGVMVLLTGFIAAGSLLVRSTLDTARVNDATLPMNGLLESGLELTAYQLFVVNAAPTAISGRRVKFTEGWIAPQIHDEAGKADLNGSDPKLLAAIFQTAGLDSRTSDTLLAYVIEMRGLDRVPSVARTSSDNAPPPIAASAPSETQPAAKPAPRGFLSIDQLIDGPDLTRDDWRALRPLVTVFNPDGKINVLSASSLVLAAIPGLSSADVEMILARRDLAATKEIEDLLSTNAEAKTYLKTTFGPAFTVRIDAVSAKGRQKAVNAVVAASASPDEPYYVLDWWE